MENGLNVASIPSDATTVARRVSLLTLALVVGVTAMSLAGFFLMRRGIETQNDRLLQADAGQAAQLLAADFGGLSASLASLGTVAQITSGDPGAFDQHAQALAVHGSSVALVRHSGGQFVVNAAAGPGFTPGQAVGTRLASDLGGAGAQLHIDLLSRVGGSDTLAFFVGPPLTPPGTTVVDQVTFNVAATGAATKSGPFKNLDFALYASKSPIPAALVLSTSGHALSGPHTAHVLSTVGADSWLVVVKAKVPLVGAFASGAPWIVLGVGLVVAFMSAAVVQSLKRRERFAAGLVARRTAELERQTAQVSLLSEVADTLQSCLNIEEVGEVVTRYAEGLLPESSGALYVIAASRNELDVAAQWGDLQAFPFFAPDDCWALRRGRAHRTGASHDGMRCAHLHGDETDSLCIPMLAQSETVGLLHVSRRGVFEGEGSTPLDALFQPATTFAEHLALAVANLQLREKLRNQSIRDPLTGLFNRRYMEESLERELHRAARHSTEVGVLMLDLDHFKEFNDSFGHESGDLALCKVAEVFLSNLRGEDIACRYGGEEFVLVLPGASIEDARLRALAIAEHIRNQPPLPSADGGATRTLTVSIGVAAFPTDGSAGKDIVRVADTLLYQAKASGRDRVVASHPLGEPRIH